MSSDRAKPQLFRNLTTRLANDNRQVGGIVEGIFEHIEALHDAASRSDWHEVRRMAELIFVDCLIYGFSELADAAAQIVNASTLTICLADIEKPLDILLQAGRADESLKQRPRRRPSDS